MLHVHEHCNSSLDMAWDLIRKKMMAPGDSVLCLTQSKGRGRMGRSWESARGDILAAWMIPNPGSGWQNKLLPLIVGLSLRQSMLSLGISLNIKWPNDLIYGHRKVGGMLIEERRSLLLAGIGINLVSSPDSIPMREQSTVQPGNIGKLLPGLGPVNLWAELVYRAHFWYEDILCNFSLIDFTSEINSNLWMMGENVIAESGQGTVKGVLRGVGEEGELLIEHSSGMARIVSGSLIKGEDSQME